MAHRDSHRTSRLCGHLRGLRPLNGAEVPRTASIAFRDSPQHMRSARLEDERAMTGWININKRGACTLCASQEFGECLRRTCGSLGLFWSWVSVRCGKDCLGLGHGAQVQLPTWRRISAAWQGPDLMLAGLVTCLAYALLSDVRVWFFLSQLGPVGERMGWERNHYSKAAEGQSHGWNWHEQEYVSLVSGFLPDHLNI